MFLLLAFSRKFPSIFSMENDSSWVVVDTETSGLCSPIYCVEIAAQKMRGWQTDGEPFRVFINHNVSLEPGAVRVHGYTRHFLDRHGIDPSEAYTLWRTYVGSLPLVAHNLKFDWDRVLLPEYARLGIAPIGTPGFCTLKLARRMLPETHRHGLCSLSAVFDLYDATAHKAINDVHATVRLLRSVLRPRLNQNGIFTFSEIRKLCNA